MTSVTRFSCHFLYHGNICMDVRIKFPTDVAFGPSINEKSTPHFLKLQDDKPMEMYTKVTGIKKCSFEVTCPLFLIMMGNTTQH